MTADGKEVDAWGVPFEQRKRDCAAGLHFFGPTWPHNLRRCAHCRATVDADDFFAEAVCVAIRMSQKDVT